MDLLPSESKEDLFGGTLSFSYEIDVFNLEIISQYFPDDATARTYVQPQHKAMVM